MRRRSLLFPADSMTRLIVASALLSAGAVAWTLWPQAREAPARAPEHAGIPAELPESRRIPSPGVTAQVPVLAAPATGPGSLTEPEPAADPLPADSQTLLPAGTESLADAAAQPAGETLYLTIIGDQTFIRRGAAGERTDPGPGWAAAQAGTQALAATLAGDPLPAAQAAWADPAGPAVAQPPATTRAGLPPGTAGTDRGRLTAGGPPEGTPPDNEEPLIDNRPWPQPGCPWTLGPESGQSMADQLRDLYGCRYLSSCQVQTGLCTWHYQGGS